MDKPSNKQRIVHILNAIILIEDFVSKVDETDFLNDIKLQSAVQYQFLILGEATKYIDDVILKRYIFPWHISKSLRNFIMNKYHWVKMERIYYAAKDLQGLKTQIQLILQNEF